MASEHDFDWVTAQYNCSLPVQFSLLQQSAEKSVAVRKEVFGGAPLDRLRFEEISDAAFSVTLASRHYPKTVVICLLEDHIDVVKVENNNRSTMFKVTLELNGEGECVFQIDGAGEFLRWQVARRALTTFGLPSGSLIAIRRYFRKGNALQAACYDRVMSEQEQENHLAKLVLEERKAQKKLACLTSKARQTADILHVVMDALKQPIGIDFSLVRKQYLEVTDTDIGSLIAETESTLGKLAVLDREIKAIEHPSRP